MRSQLWTEDDARHYDDNHDGKFDLAILGPTVDFLSALAAGAAGSHEPTALELAIGDMSTATAPPPGPDGFHLVYLVYNTITNLLTQDAQVDCFVNAARHLRPGGFFVIENFVPELRRLPPGQGAMPCVLTDDHLNLDTIDTVSQRLTSHHFRRHEDGTWSRSASEHRYSWPAELDLMARIAGMEFVRRVADWDGSVFDETSGSAVSVWRRLD